MSPTRTLLLLVWSLVTAAAEYEHITLRDGTVRTGYFNDSTNALTLVDGTTITLRREDIVRREIAVPPGEARISIPPPVQATPAAPAPSAPPAPTSPSAPPTKPSPPSPTSSSPESPPRAAPPPRVVVDPPRERLVTCLEATRFNLMRSGEDVVPERQAVHHRQVGATRAMRARLASATAALHGTHDAFLREIGR